MTGDGNSFREQVEEIREERNNTGDDDTFREQDEEIGEMRKREGNDDTFRERVEGIRERRKNTDNDNISSSTETVGFGKSLAGFVGGLFAVGVVLGAFASGQFVFGLLIIVIGVMVLGWAFSDEGDPATEIQEMNEKQSDSTTPTPNRICPNCGWQNPQENEYCHDCGIDLK